MQDLVLSNIKKSLNAISNDECKFSLNQVKIINNRSIDSENSSSDIINAVSSSTLTIFPLFYRDDRGELCSPQADIFGFYAFRNIVRGCLISKSFVESGNLLLESGFYAMATFSYYTAIYHCLNSYLTLHGRSYVESIYGLPIITYANTCSSETFEKLPNAEMIVAKLTKNNTWKFEAVTRNHMTRWYCLEEILNKIKIPPYFEIFLTYLTGIENNDKNELLKQGIKISASYRHQAIYQGFGFDDDAYDAVLNHENTQGVGLEDKCHAFKKCAYHLLDDCTDKAIFLFESIPKEIYCPSMYVFKSSVFRPPFELAVKINLDNLLYEKLNKLQKLMRADIMYGKDKL